MDGVSDVAEITRCIYCQDREGSTDAGSCIQVSPNFLVRSFHLPLGCLGKLPPTPEPKLHLDQPHRKAECQNRLWLGGLCFLPQKPSELGSMLSPSSSVQAHGLSSRFWLHWQVSWALKPPIKTQLQPTSLSSCVARFNK